VIIFIYFVVLVPLCGNDLQVRNRFEPSWVLICAYTFVCWFFFSFPDTYARAFQKVGENGKHVCWIN